jgi:hypothetical protein
MAARNSLSMFFGAFLLVVVCGLCAMAQDGKGRQIARLKSGGFVAFKTTTEPATTQEFSFSGTETDSDVVHRVLIDKSGSFYFGYDLEVEPVFETRQFRVRVLPLSREFEEQLRSRKDFKAKPVGPDSNLAPISKSSTIETLNDGDAVALDVLVNPETQVKIVDLISVSFDYVSLREAPVSKSPSRDYTLDDVELKISNYKLAINGEVIAGSKPTGGYGGPIVWFYVPGRGRFIFSLTPHAGYDFRKIGTIEHNRIAFSIGSDRYEWTSSNPIVGSGGNWNLWILQDPGYVSEFAEPTDPVTNNTKPQSASRDTSGAALKPSQTSALARPEAFIQSSEAKTGMNNGTTARPLEPDEPLPKSPPRRIRPIFGAADRVENLLPRK